MVNDDSPLYTLKIRWELHKLGTYFLPIYIMDHCWQIIFLPPFKMAAKEKFVSLWQTELDI